MIRLSEMVLSGHPDKFCDQVADAIIAAAMEFERDAYGQIEVAAWCDDLWLNGGIATTRPLPFTLEQIVGHVVERVGYVDRDGVPRRFRVHSETVCLDVVDPTRWTHKVNDQSIVVGYAGYDARTAFLPPEHFAAHTFREALEEAVAGGHVAGGHVAGGHVAGGRPRPPVTGVEPVTPPNPEEPEELRGTPRNRAGGGGTPRNWTGGGTTGVEPVTPPNPEEPEELQGTPRNWTGGGGMRPDGKLLVRIREERDEWRIEHILVTIQQSESVAFLEVVEEVIVTIRNAYAQLREHDPRWCAEWEDIELLVNPNGPLVSGGSDGDNGQTGRKLVMDYYGPRVAIGGGALSGKHLTHIDRIAAYTAREAAVRTLASMRTGDAANECRVVLAYAPNCPAPLDVIYEMTVPGERMPSSFFGHDAMRDRFTGVQVSTTMARGDHFFNTRYHWNQ